MHLHRCRGRMATLVLVCVTVGLIGLIMSLFEYKLNVKLQKSQCKTRSIIGRYRTAAVAADADVCSKIGTDIMAFKGGSAVDAAIAAMVCVGVYNMHSAGLGGGSIALVYNPSATNTTDNISVFNARGKAPKAASKNLFLNNKKDTPTWGGLAITVPCEMKGYRAMHAKYGKMPWKKLFEPTIELCENGFAIGPALAKAIMLKRSTIKKSHSLKFLLTDKNNNLMKEGSILKHPKLAKTLRTIADDNTYDTFYGGKLADDIIADLKEQGSIITKEDLEDSTVVVKKPLDFKLGSDTIYLPPLPSSSAIILYMFNILKGYKMTAADIADDSSTTLTYHRIIEAMKYAFAKRSEMGDDAFVDVTQLMDNITSPQFGEQTQRKIIDKTTFAPEHYGAKFIQDEIEGTSHVSVVDAEGFAVSLTSTINTFFGSHVLGSRTGILFNNNMDDFSVPGVINKFGFLPSRADIIEPGKYPLSSMSPCIVFDTNGRVKLVVGASGGSRIISGVFLVMYRVLVLGQTIEDAVDSTRIHHQVLSDYIFHERSLSEAIKTRLRRKGHKLKQQDYMSSVQAIHRVDNYIYALSDVRKSGRADGY